MLTRRFTVLSLGAALGLAIYRRGAAEPSYVLDPEVEHYLSQIDAPERVYRVARSGTNASSSKKQQIVVIGPLSDVDVRALLTTAGYHRTAVYRIVGDARYAQVCADEVCDKKCALAADLFFANSPAGWRFLGLTEHIS